MAGMERLVAPAETLEVLHVGFLFVEGPVWHAGSLYFNDIPDAKRYVWSPSAGVQLVDDSTNKGNGMDVDMDGRLLVCEQTTSVVARFPDPASSRGRVVVASHYDGKELNSPNDVVVAPDRSFYFTDPTYGREYERVGLLRPLQLPFCGVFRVPDGAAPTETQLLADDFEAPNGLCFSPDYRVLYVNDTARKHIRRFDVEGDGTLKGGEVFADFSEDEAPGSLDGMECDEAGNVWVTGPGGIWAIDADGVKIGVVEVPEQAGSLVWGGDDGQELFITAKTSLYRVRTHVRGVQPAA